MKKRTNPTLQMERLAIKIQRIRKWSWHRIPRLTWVMNRWNTIYFKQERLPLHRTIAKLRSSTLLFSKIKLRNSPLLFSKIRLYKWRKRKLKMTRLYLKLELRVKAWKDQILGLHFTEMRLKLSQLQMLHKSKPINQRISIQKAYLKLKRLSKAIWGFYKSSR